MPDYDPEVILSGVGAKTARKDNTRTQRIKALKVLTDQGFELHEAASILGIDPEWVTTPDPASVNSPSQGTRYRRRHRNGPVSL